MGLTEQIVHYIFGNKTSQMFFGLYAFYRVYFRIYIVCFQEARCLANTLGAYADPGISVIGPNNVSL